jgi:hypothetical protein
VGTSRDALPATDAPLIVDAEQHRFVHRHRNGVGRADANTGQARDAELGVDDEIQRPGPSGGRVCNLTVTHPTVKTLVAAKYVYSRT